MDEKCKLYGYGFACSRHGIIGKFSAEIDNLLDLKNPEDSLIDERSMDCLKHDQLKFDAEHYMYVAMLEFRLRTENLVFFLFLKTSFLFINLYCNEIVSFSADLFEKNSLLDDCLQFEYPETMFDLSFKSRDRLKDLPKKSFPKYSSHLEKTIALSLIDILFAYLYDLRTTCAEHSSESGRFLIIQFKLFKIYLNMDCLLYWSWMHNRKQRFLC